jgi:nucleoside-diphosphate-sugar epimerase
MKNVLIPGGAGYLGSIATEHLLGAGYKVTVLDNLRYGQAGLLHHCANPAFDFVYGDARDERTMKDALKKADAVIHLAAIVGAPACDRDPWEAETINVGAVKLLKKLRSPSQLVVYPTTNSGYGVTTGETFCTEETPLSPISLYGRQKAEAETTLLATPNTVTLRLATVFGMSPRMRLDLLVNDFTWAAVKTGYLVIFEKHFKRNFVHIRDVADCFLHCLKNSKKMAGRTYNLGLDSANLSKEELALTIKKYVPSFHIQFSEIGKDNDKRNYVVSSARLKKAGFEAKRTLDQGIQELIKGFRMIGRGGGPMKNA